MRNLYSNETNYFSIDGIDMFNEYAEITGQPFDDNWDENFLMLWVTGVISSIKDLDELNSYFEMGYVPALNHPTLGLFLVRNKNNSHAKEYKNQVMSMMNHYFDGISSVINSLKNLEIEKEEDERKTNFRFSLVINTIPEEIIHRLSNLLPTGYYENFQERKK